MTSTPLMERPRNDRTYSAVVPGLVPTAFTHLAWRFRGGDKYRCRPGACPRDPSAFARGDAVCGLLPGPQLARRTLPSCSAKAAKALGPGNKCRDRTNGVLGKKVPRRGYYGG